MDFTREPVIESVITPKEGFILAVRSSKGTGQEEYFVDALELVSFGNVLFYRSQERPKNFLLPVADYEVLEVREARLVLKNVGLDRSIKIAGGREGSMRGGGKAPQQEKIEQPAEEPAEGVIKAQPSEAQAENKLGKKRDRRRNSRRKRGPEAEGETEAFTEVSEDSLQKPAKAEVSAETPEIGAPLPAVFSSLLPPPATLISETIARYKDNALFRGAFFLKDEEKEGESEKKEEGEAESSISAEIEKPVLDLPDEDIEMPTMTLDYPQYVSREMSEEEQERVYQERQALRLSRQQVSKESAVEEHSSEVTEEKQES